MKIYILSSVRGASEDFKKHLEDYVNSLEEKGHKVHLPHRDTNQNARGYDICKQNTNAILFSDEVHVFYNSKSQGSHFDLGVAFAFNKKIVVIENEKIEEGKSFARMIKEWEDDYAIQNQRLKSNR